VKDLVIMLESRVKEIDDWQRESDQEREKLMSRLNDLDARSQEAAHDKRRIKAAIKALEKDTDAENKLAEVCGELAAPSPPYWPGNDR
jgi:predicted transcriptional regulator